MQKEITGEVSNGTNNIIKWLKKKNSDFTIKEKMRTVFGSRFTNVCLNLLFSLSEIGRREKKIIKENQELKDMYTGQRCFIIGNGPSVKEMNLSALENEKVFSVNQFCKTNIYKEIKPSFHLWSDERFFNIDSDDIGDLEILNDMKRARLSSDEPIVFYKTTAESMIRKYGLDKCLNIKYYADRITFDQNYRKDIDLAKYIPWFPTVVQYAIVIAIYMGFTDIYLLGCECTGILNFIKEKDKKNTQGEYAYSYVLNEAERKNFSTSLKGRTSAQEFMGHYKVLNYYESLEKYCRLHHVNLVNCTPGGLLDSLPREDFDRVITNEKEL